MFFRLKERLGRKFEEEVQFFKGWRKDKTRVGALMATSVLAARHMAIVINPVSGMPVLELGTGTGVITKAILVQRRRCSRTVRLGKEVLPRSIHR